MATKTQAELIAIGVQVYRMKHVEGKSRDTIAKELKVSTHTVTNYLKRGRAIFDDMRHSVLWARGDEVINAVIDKLLDQLDDPDTATAHKAIKRLMKYYGADRNLKEQHKDSTPDMPTG